MTLHAALSAAAPRPDGTRHARIAYTCIGRPLLATRYPDGRVTLGLPVGGALYPSTEAAVVPEAREGWETE